MIIYLDGSRKPDAVSPETPTLPGRERLRKKHKRKHKEMIKVVVIGSDERKLSYDKIF